VPAEEVADLVQEVFARAFGDRARLAYDGLQGETQDAQKSRAPRRGPFDVVGAEGEDRDVRSRRPGILDDACQEKGRSLGAHEHQLDAEVIQKRAGGGWRRDADQAKIASTFELRERPRSRGGWGNDDEYTDRHWARSLGDRCSSSSNWHRLPPPT
jgi:hypothetical protein